MEEIEIGDYKLLQQLDCDLFEHVFLAEHNFLKKLFVLKVFPEAFYSLPGFEERFKEKVAFLATLDHPNITKVHDASLACGKYFVATDCVSDDSGQITTLQQFLEQKSLTESENYQLLYQIAEAIDFAHRQNIVHGLLRPSNIFIGKDNKPVLSDFWLTKMLGEKEVLSCTFKKVAERLAKKKSCVFDEYAFLAPEQKRGEETTFASDLYSFGILAHHVIFKHAPEGKIASLADLPQYKYQWSLLFDETLSYQSEKRRKGLVSLLQEMSAEKKVSSSLFAAPRLVEENKREHPAFAPSFEPMEIEAMAYAQDSKVSKFGSQSENPIHLMLKKDPVVSGYHPEKKDTKDIEPIPTEMVTIPEGLFYRGNNQGNRDEAPRHRVYLDAFAIDIHPVTNEQFIRFLEYMGGEKDLDYHDLIRLKDSRINRAAGKISIESGYAKHPVVGVTWYGAYAYAAWVGKRLPTEAEWEKAAIGGVEDTLYPNGHQIEKTEANFFSSDTTPVMSYPPNPFGLYDMAGNVYEWCQDWYSYNYYEFSSIEPNNPKGPLQGVYRVLRGGCWKSLKPDLRVSHRHRNNPGTVNGTYGFRCAKTLTIN